MARTQTRDVVLAGGGFSITVKSPEENPDTR